MLQVGQTVTILKGAREIWTHFTNRSPDEAIAKLRVSFPHLADAKVISKSREEQEISRARKISCA